MNSVQLSVSSTSQKEGEEQNLREFWSKTRVFDLLGVPKITCLKIFKNMADKRRAIRTGQALGDFRILSTKRDSFYKKVPPFG